MLMWWLKVVRNDMSSYHSIWYHSGKNTAYIITCLASSSVIYVHLLYKKVGFKKDRFIKYVTCPNPDCTKTYAYSDCVERVGTQTISKRCNHKINTRRNCSSLLLKTVELATNKRVLYPFKVYCYISTYHRLITIINLKERLNWLLWRMVQTYSGKLSCVYEDVFDGNVWKEFQISVFCTCSKIQLMQRFIRDEFFSSLLQPLDFNEFVPILDQLKASFTGSLGETFSVPWSGDLAAVINLPNKCTRDNYFQYFWTFPVIRSL